MFLLYSNEIKQSPLVLRSFYWVKTPSDPKHLLKSCWRNLNDVSAQICQDTQICNQKPFQYELKCFLSNSCRTKLFELWYPHCFSSYCILAIMFLFLLRICSKNTWDQVDKLMRYKWKNYASINNYTFLFINNCFTPKNNDKKNVLRQNWYLL